MMQRVELSLDCGVGIRTFVDRANSIGARQDDRARIEGDSERDCQHDGRAAPPYPRRAHRSEVYGEHEAESPHDVAEHVVAREDCADELAGLGPRQHGEHCRRREEREEHNPAKPASERRQVNRQNYDHQLSQRLGAPGSACRSEKPVSTLCHATTRDSPNCQQRKTTSSPESWGKSMRPRSMSLRMQPKDSICAAASAMLAVNERSSG